MNKDFQQVKTGKDNYTIITDDIIDKIPKIQAFENTELNNKMYEFHKELLRLAKKFEDREVGLFWDLDNIEKKPLVIIGEKDGIRIDKNRDVLYMIKYTNKCRNIVVMHNHPRNGLFSSKDIKSFTEFNSVYIMTAVCNDGTIYMLRKESNFNPFAIKMYYNKGLREGYEKIKQEQQKKIKRYKLDINNPKDREKIMEKQIKPPYNGIKYVAKNASKIGITYRCSVKRKEK